ncbi:hypothetical protein AB0G15_36715 [Streptosporangium sp. NPDC023825]|uniref:hypothetical protein n=1 Tax=Streptosporangium sp. NPDC023825 TaxID=3154909 RepID=UPI00341441B0
MAGGIWAASGFAFVVSGAMQAPHIVAVYVHPIPHRLPLSVSAAKDMSAGAMFRPPNILMAAGSTVAENVLARGDVLLGGLCAGGAGLLLHRLFRSFLHDPPARRRNPARILWLGVLSLVAGAAGPAIPVLASSMVLDRTKLADACRPAALYSGVSAVLLVGGVLLLVLAEIYQSRAKPDEPRPRDPVS